MRHMLWIAFLLLSFLTSCIHHEVENFSLIGRWEVAQVSGGITGKGYKPLFKYMEIIDSSRCQWRDSLLEVMVTARCWISPESVKKGQMYFFDFNPDTIDVIDTYQVQYSFMGADTLLLDEGCCDRYQYEFVRVE